jgi:signal transduction histidine kinase
VNLLLQRLITEKAERFMGGDVFQRPTPSESGQHLYFGSSVNPVQDLGASVLAYQWNITWIAVAVLAVVGVVAGWLLAGRLLRPVHRITATARRLSLSTLHERIALTGPRDELRELADTFDAMLDRLERAADSQRRFAANASHELRTPLAIQRAAIEIGLHDPSPDQLARMRRELLQANERTERLIDGLLALAQGERGLERREPVNLADLADEVADQHRPMAVENGVEIDLDLEAVTVTGDPVLLTRLVANLLHNAIRHNHPGGAVRVRTSATTGLTVTNTGPRIPADRVPELFEPFRRPHPPRTGPSEGAGLGLSIVAAIADAHHAHVDASPNPDGGLTVTVALPTSGAVISR